MVALLSRRSNIRILSVFMMMVFMAVISLQPVEAGKGKIIGAVTGGVIGGVVAWQLACLLMMGGVIGGGIVLGIVLPAIVTGVVGAWLGGSLGAWIEKKFGGGSKAIQIDKASDF